MLIFPAKKLRARLIAEHMREAGHSRAVCISCGNASRALAEEGVDVIALAPNGPLLPNRWLRPADLHRLWPDAFDATSGHLSLALMVELGRYYRVHLGNIGRGPHVVPSGSGETVVALALAYPDSQFIARYNVPDLPDATAYCTEAPLNGVVSLLCDKVEGVGCERA